MPTSATNEMLDAFRYNRFAEVAFAEKCQFFTHLLAVQGKPTQVLLSHSINRDRQIVKELDSKSFTQCVVLGSNVGV